MMFHVVLNKDENGWIVAECPALPGCFSQGRTEQEALANIKEAITGWLSVEAPIQVAPALFEADCDGGSPLSFTPGPQ